MYHLVFPAKYRRVVFDGEVETVLKEVCLDIEKRYELKFLEIGADQDHVHFLVQSIPTYSVAKIVGVIKSITAREIFTRCPQVKKLLWGDHFGLPDTLQVRWVNTEMKIWLKLRQESRQQISTNSPGSPIRAVRYLDPWVEVTHSIRLDAKCVTIFAGNYKRGWSWAFG